MNKRSTNNVTKVLRLTIILYAPLSYPPHCLHMKADRTGIVASKQKRFGATCYVEETEALDERIGEGRTGEGPVAGIGGRWPQDEAGLLDDSCRLPRSPVKRQ